MSPRPRKPRLCCPHRAPGSLVFKPAGTPLSELERIDLKRDELEALRLCDLDGLSQEAAGGRMGVSRGTVQRLVSGARRKVAAALVAGSALHIAPWSEEMAGEEGSDDGETDG
ncbi:MAG: DUF134 domain-containing protein [Trichloromonas sp.]|jgi:predicted DNA-binding protein (UPF0251 family)|nr:DUF134 domain-containing protein [Trichloromonas sp.]